MYYHIRSITPHINIIRCSLTTEIYESQSESLLRNCKMYYKSRPNKPWDNFSFITKILGLLLFCCCFHLHLWVTMSQTWSLCSWRFLWSIFCQRADIYCFFWSPYNLVSILNRLPTMLNNKICRQNSTDSPKWRSPCRKKWGERT